MDRRAVALLLAVVLPATWATEATAQVAVTVETSIAARRKLRLVDEYLGRQAWDEGVVLLRQTLDEHAGSLVEVAPGRYLEVSGRINRLLVALPPEALAVYRRGVDPQARRWFETGRDQHDDASLRRVLERAYASRWADEALWLLGQRAWAADRPRQAAGYWRQLLSADPADPAVARGTGGGPPRFPDSRHASADVRARLVLCHCLDGRLDLARTAWGELKQRHPDAVGTLAGTKGRLVELVAGWVALAELWPIRSSGGGHLTFAGSPARNGITNTPLDPGGPLWQLALDSDLSAGVSSRTDRYPVVLGEKLFVADSFGLRGFDLNTGRPAWSPGPAARDEDRGVATSAHVVYPPPPSGLPVRAARPRSGTVCTSLSVSGGWLYARVGSPVTARAPREPRPLFHELVGVDLTRGQGKLVLQIETSSVPVSDIRGEWSFDGPPLVAANRLYVATRRGHPQVELGLACFDARDGTFAWHHRLAAGVTSVAESHNVVTHNVLSLADGTLFYSGDAGLSAALDPDTGTIAWINVHEPPDGSGPFCSLPDPAAGLLYVRSGPDAVAALSAHDGRLAWLRKLPGGVAHLLAARDGLLIVSGRSLWALDIAGGRIAWQRLARRAHQAGHGRGLVAQNVVYWPTRDLLHLLDLATGRPLRQPLRLDIRGATGGNLLLAGRRLVLCGNGRLSVLGPFAGLRPPTAPLVTGISRTGRLPVVSGVPSGLGLLEASTPGCLQPGLPENYDLTEQ